MKYINGRKVVRLTENKEQDGFKEARAFELVKLEKKGDIVKGIFLSLEESKKFPGSWALKYNDDDKNMSVFINKIGYELFTANVTVGKEFILTHDGKVKTADKSKEYHTYKLLYK